MFNYKPGPTGARFLADEQSFVKLIMGPVGGGKSTVALMDVLRRVIRQKPYKNVRNSKVIILRNTMAQLKSTVKPLIDTWFTTLPAVPMGDWRISDNTYDIRIKLKDGTICKADLIMMAADTPDDVRRLLSVECSFAWVEECREVDPEVFSGLQGRTNRWPSMLMGGVTYPGVIGSTNAPPQGTFWHEVITTPPPKWSVFIQPPAMLEDGKLNPDAENLENLAATYYEDLIGGKTQEWIDVYLKNKFGSGGAGLPVFRNSFRKAFHVAAAPLTPLVQTAAGLAIGMDNGLTAAAVLGQMDARGRVNILDNAFVPIGVTMGVERFLDTILIPLLIAKYPFRRENILFILDPACFERSQINEKTIDMSVRARGFRTKRAPTNDPERRIASVEGLLARSIDGGPGFLISPTCTHLINAYEYGYKFKATKDPSVAPSIDKTNHFTHVADASEYLCLHYNEAVDPMLAGFRTKARVIAPSSYMYTPQR